MTLSLSTMECPDQHLPTDVYKRQGVNYKTWPDDSHRLLAAGFIGYQFAAPAELMRDYDCLLYTSRCV